MSFREKWPEAVEKKNSVLCAGLDPAEYEIGRKGKGRPEGADKRDFCMSYLEDVAPYCAGMKFNPNYWKGEEDEKILRESIRLAHSLNLVVIDDSKFADISDSNDAGLFYSAQRSADAVTVAPFAGNLAEAVRQGRKRGIGIISMCLMSNEEYEREKNMLVDISPDFMDYKQEDIFYVEGVPCTRRFLQLAHDANKHRADGVVIGAPSPINHITEEDIERIRRYTDDEMLVLMPGIGAQGGEAGAVQKFFAPDNVIVNIGRALMFTKDSSWKETAEYYRNMLNELRAA